MADTVVAKNSDTLAKQPHATGQFPAQCVDVINLGERVEDFTGKPKKLTKKCALVFRTGERGDTGDVIDISREFTVSMGELSNLRKFLEQWRGKAYTEDQINEGVPLHKLEGQWALIQVDHKRSGGGKTYAVIQSAVPVPKQMKDHMPELTPYTRAEWWEDRKKEYADGARKYRVEIGAPASHDPEDEDQSLGTDDDDLPF